MFKIEKQNCIMTFLCLPPKIIVISRGVGVGRGCRICHIISHEQTRSSFQTLDVVFPKDLFSFFFSVYFIFFFFLPLGTTLTQEMTYLVMTLNFKTAKTVILDDRFPFIDTKDLNYPYFRGLEYLANLPSDEPRFIKTHCHYFLLPDDITQRKKRKGI